MPARESRTQPVSWHSGPADPVERVCSARWILVCDDRAFFKTWLQRFKEKHADDRIEGYVLDLKHGLLGKELDNSGLPVEIRHDIRILGARFSDQEAVEDFHTLIHDCGGVTVANFLEGKFDHAGKWTKLADACKAWVPGIEERWLGETDVKDDTSSQDSQGPVNAAGAGGPKVKEAPLAADQRQKEAHTELRERLEQSARAVEAQSSRRLRVFIPMTAVGLAAAACLVFFLLPPPLRVDAFSVSMLRGSRGASVPLVCDVTITLNEPAYVRIVMIDDRNEPWIMPFGDDRSGTPREYVERIQGAKEWTVPGLPNPEHPKAKAIFAIIVASKGEAPATEALLEAIPDPVAPPSANADTVRRAVTQVCIDLENRFKGCVVEFRPIPKASAP